MQPRNVAMCRKNSDSHAYPTLPVCHFEQSKGVPVGLQAQKYAGFLKTSKMVWNAMAELREGVGLW